MNYNYQMPTEATVLFSVNGLLTKGDAQWDGDGIFSVVHKGIATPMPFAGRWTKERLPGYLSHGLSSADEALEVLHAAITLNFTPKNLNIKLINACKSDSDLKAYLLSSGIALLTKW